MKILSAIYPVSAVYLTLVVFGTTLLCKSTALGLMQAATYQEMLAKADLIVIARPVSTADTAERTVLQKLGSNDFAFRDGPEVSVIGVNTTLDVRAVLKGNKDLKQFVLHHYRLMETQAAVVGGPDFIAFDLKQPSMFLMFLVKEADGRYAPASGQVDPRAFSILEINGSAD